MAVSEGQIAVELVQALTAEARAHREYLEQLYLATITILGGGLLLLSGAIFWFLRHSISQIRKGAEEELKSKIAEIIEENQLSVEKDVESLRVALKKHEDEAREQLDVIVSYASDISVYRERKEERDPELTPDVFFISEIIKGDDSAIDAFKLHGSAVAVATPSEFGLSDVNWVNENNIVVIFRPGNMRKNEVNNFAKFLTSKVAAENLAIYFDKEVNYLYYGIDRFSILVGSSSLLSFLARKRPRSVQSGFDL